MSIIDTFQDLIAEVPDLIQPLIIAAAGAIPFIEGEGAATLGIVGGINPVTSVVAAIIGNFICVFVLVWVSSRANDIVVTHHRQRVLSGEKVTTRPGGGVEEYATNPQESKSRKSVRKAKFQHALSRYGVPGVSLLGPLVLPTQFTATLLAAAGVHKTRILVWQIAAIILWTTIIALLISGFVDAAH